jgi:alkaline phosphatase
MAAYMTGYKMNNEVISMTPDTSAYNKTSFADYVSGADSTCPAAAMARACPRCSRSPRPTAWPPAW